MAFQVKVSFILFDTLHLRQIRFRIRSGMINFVLVFEPSNMLLLKIHKTRIW